MYIISRDYLRGKIWSHCWIISLLWKSYFITHSNVVSSSSVLYTFHMKCVIEILVLETLPIIECMYFFPAANSPFDNVYYLDRINFELKEKTPLKSINKCGPVFSIVAVEIELNPGQAQKLMLNHWTLRNEKLLWTTILNSYFLLFKHIKPVCILIQTFHTQVFLDMIELLHTCNSLHHKHLAFSIAYRFTLPKSRHHFEYIQLCSAQKRKFAFNIYLIEIRRICCINAESCWL